MARTETVTDRIVVNAKEPKTKKKNLSINTTAQRQTLAIEYKSTFLFFLHKPTTIYTLTYIYNTTGVKQTQETTYYEINRT